MSRCFCGDTHICVTKMESPLRKDFKHRIGARSFICPPALPHLQLILLVFRAFLFSIIYLFIDQMKANIHLQCLQAAVKRMALIPFSRIVYV